MSLFGGIIAGAMGGAGQAGVQALNVQQQQDGSLYNAEKLAQMNSDLEEQRAQHLINFQNLVNDQQREQQSARIDAAKQGIIAQQMNGIYGDFDAAANGTPNNATPLTDAQQAVIDAAAPQVAKQQQDAAAAMMGDPGIAVQAAANTGDLGPKDVAAMVAQINAQKYGIDRQSQQEATQFAMQAAQIQAAADNQARYLAAMTAKGTGSANANTGTSPGMPQRMYSPILPPGVPPGSIFIGTKAGAPVYKGPDGNNYAPKQ